MAISNTKYKQTELGEIPEDWEVLNISDLGSVVTGKTPPTNNPENYGGRYPFICIPDMGSSVYIKSTNKTISEEGLQTVRNCLLPKNSVMVSCIATIGKVGMTDKLSVTNQQINSVVPNEKVDPLFLFYRLNNFEKILSSFGGGGAVFDIISKSKFEKIPLPIPPLLEQQKIAEVLGALDQKIELNRKMNKTLESLAQAIFKKWFIDDADPNWEIKKLGDLLDIDRGLSYKGKYLSDVGIPMFNLGSFNLDGSLKLDTLKYYSGDFKNNCTVNAGDIIVANTDMTQNRVILGSPCIIPDLFHDQNVLFTHHLYALRPVNEINKMFIYRSLKTREFKDQAIGFATGTTVLFLPKEAILSYEIKYPSIVRLEEFNSFYRNILKQQLVLTKEIETLSQIRDSLLPRLMSGKLRVK